MSFYTKRYAIDSPLWNGAGEIADRELDFRTALR